MTEKEKTPKGAELEVKAVEVKSGDDADAEYLQRQNEALYRYKVTGIRGEYVDPTRDQEPDIAPEFGVSPHPELANPPAPEGPYTGVNLDPDRVHVLKSPEEKTKAYDEAAKREEETATKQREQLEGEDAEAGDNPVDATATSAEALVSQADVRAGAQHK
jgi:hypothetical protein